MSWYSPRTFFYQSVYTRVCEGGHALLIRRLMMGCTPRQAGTVPRAAAEVSAALGVPTAQLGTLVRSVLMLGPTLESAQSKWCLWNDVEDIATRHSGGRVSVPHARPGELSTMLTFPLFRTKTPDDDDDDDDGDDDDDAYAWYTYAGGDPHTRGLVTATLDFLENLSLEAYTGGVAVLGKHLSCWTKTVYSNLRKNIVAERGDGQHGEVEAEPSELSGFSSSNVELNRWFENDLIGY